VVFPDADLKVFLTATEDCRARRRFSELQQRGDPSSFEQVLADQRRRDKNDSEREHAPLKPAADARIFDTSGIPLGEVVEQLAREVEATLAARGGAR
jgi:cytidylate kinase